VITDTPFRRYNRLSHRLSNRFDNRVEQTATVRSTGSQTGLYNRFDNRLYRVYKTFTRLSMKERWGEKGDFVGKLENIV